MMIFKDHLLKNLFPTWEEEGPHKVFQEQRMELAEMGMKSRLWRWWQQNYVCEVAFKPENKTQIIPYICLVIIQGRFKYSLLFIYTSKESQCSTSNENSRSLRYQEWASYRECPWVLIRDIPNKSQLSFFLFLQIVFPSISHPLKV